MERKRKYDSQQHGQSMPMASQKAGDRIETRVGLELLTLKLKLLKLELEEKSREERRSLFT